MQSNQTKRLKINLKKNFILQSVIDKDKENYLGWVMTGAAANELNNKDQALAAYQRAIQISSNQAPAWQGLAQLYEKTNSQSELISVYSELRKFFSKYYFLIV